LENKLLVIYYIVK